MDEDEIGDLVDEIGIGIGIIGDLVDEIGIGICGGGVRRGTVL